MLEEVNRELVSGVNIAEISRMCGCSHDAVTRHKRNHLARTLVKAEIAGKPTSLEARLTNHEAHLDRALEDLDMVPAREKAGLLRESRELIALLMKRDSLLPPETQVTIINTPQWVAVTNVLWAELHDHPELRERIAAALERAGI
jgi:hypothetical protein